MAKIMRPCGEGQGWGTFLTHKYKISYHAVLLVYSCMCYRIRIHILDGYSYRISPFSKRIQHSDTTYPFAHLDNFSLLSRCISLPFFLAMANFSITSNLDWYSSFYICDTLWFMVWVWRRCDSRMEHCSL